MKWPPKAPGKTQQVDLRDPAATEQLTSTAEQWKWVANSTPHRRCKGNAEAGAQLAVMIAKLEEATNRKLKADGQSLRRQVDTQLG